MEAAVMSDPQLEFGNCVVRLVRGDITELEVGAFIFYAEPSLALGSGFGGMIHMRGGGAIQKELDDLAPAGPLEVVVSSGGRLKADYILHAVGPRFREDDIEEKLLITMGNCLLKAQEKELKSLAFPAMGAGYYGIPAGVSAKVMLDALRGFLSENSGLEEVTICVLDGPQFKAFEAAMAAASDAA